MKPYFSIIIPTYNREKIISETINSVINQNVNNWECIIVDDNSTDDSVNVVLELIKNHQNIKLVERKTKNKGASVCRNIGANNAKGDYLIFLDSDDLIKSNFIYERTLVVNKNKNLDFIVFPSGFFINEISDSKKRWNLLNKKNKDDLSRFLDQDNPWHTTGPVWKKSSFMKIGCFNGNSQSAQDWEIHVRAIINELQYIKTSDSEKNLHHFIRINEKASISTQKITKERILNRTQTFREIVHLFRKKNLHKTKLKIKLIGHFYRNSCIAYSSGFIDLAKINLKVLFEEKIISIMLYLFLVIRIKSNRNKNLKVKLIDFFLYRFHGIESIEFPKDRTRGIEIPAK